MNHLHKGRIEVDQKILIPKEIHDFILNHVPEEIFRLELYESSEPFSTTKEVIKTSALKTGNNVKMNCGFLNDSRNTSQKIYIHYDV